MDCTRTDPPSLNSVAFVRHLVLETRQLASKQAAACVAVSYHAEPRVIDKGEILAKYI